MKAKLKKLMTMRFVQDYKKRDLRFHGMTSQSIKHHNKIDTSFGPLTHCPWRGIVAAIFIQPLPFAPNGGATHIAVATDHVIESFRNGLWAG